MTLFEPALNKIRVDAAEVVAVVVVVANGNRVSRLDALLEGVILRPLMVLLVWLGHVEGSDKLKSLPG